MLSYYERQNVERCKYYTVINNTYVYMDDESVNDRSLLWKKVNNKWIYV